MSWILLLLAIVTICYIMFMYGETRRDQGYIQAVKDLTGNGEKS